MKTCNNCAHKKVCISFLGWSYRTPKLPNIDSLLTGSCKNWDLDSKAKIPIKVGDNIYMPWGSGKYGINVATFIVTKIVINDIDLNNAVIYYEKTKNPTHTVYHCLVKELGTKAFINYDEVSQVCMERNHMNKIRNRKLVALDSEGNEIPFAIFEGDKVIEVEEDNWSH